MAVPNEAFRAETLYVDYPQEQVMFRCTRTPRRVFRRFYQEAGETEVPFGSELFFEARRYGNVVTEETYAQRRP
jgi:hypothetical protein